MNLFDKRVIFMMGKGGAGKTTVSISMAIAAARMNKKILLVEIGDADSIGFFFDRSGLASTPTPIQNNIYGARIKPKTVLEEYLYSHIGIPFLVGTITSAQVFHHFADAAPGLKEIMTLGQIWKWEKESDFDLIIVDSAATGHGLSLLQQPRALHDMVRSGPIATQIKDVQNLIENPEKTGLCLVTLPEELPVNEALEFIDSVENKLGMTVDMTFMNFVYPNIFAGDDISDVENIVNFDSSSDSWFLGLGITQSLSKNGRGGIGLQVLYNVLYDKDEYSPYSGPIIYRVGFFF